MIKKAMPYRFNDNVKISNAISVDITDSVRLVWVSGQLAINEEKKIAGKGNIKLQTEQCFINIESALKEVGGNLSDVVQLTVFVKEMPERGIVSKVMQQYFNDPQPTTTSVQITDLAVQDALIEIESMSVINLNKD